MKRRKYYLAKSAAQRLKYTKKLTTLLRRIKDKPCHDCHTIYPYYVMDFDHARGRKKFTVSRCAASRYKLPVIMAEIKKCDVVCANCHRARTWKRKTAAQVGIAPTFSP